MKFFFLYFNLLQTSFKEYPVNLFVKIRKQTYTKNAVHYMNAVDYVYGGQDNGKHGSQLCEWLGIFFFFQTNAYMYLYAAVFKEEYEFVAKNFYNFSVFFLFLQRLLIFKLLSKALNILLTCNSIYKLTTQVCIYMKVSYVGVFVYVYAYEWYMWW